MKSVLLIITSLVVVIVIYRKIRGNLPPGMKTIAYKDEIYQVNDGNEKTEQRAAQLLDYFHSKNKELVTYLKTHASSDKRMRRIVDKLDSGSPPTMREVESYLDETAYSENKGDVIAICLDDFHRGKEPLNDAYFVMLHELAHVGNDSWGHDDSFWECFSHLLSHATAAGLYKWQDYSESPSSLCGKAINYQPFDCEWCERKI